MDWTRLPLLSLSIGCRLLKESKVRKTLEEWIAYTFFGYVPNKDVRQNYKIIIICYLEQFCLHYAWKNLSHQPEAYK